MPARTVPEYSRYRQKAGDPVQNHRNSEPEEKHRSSGDAAIQSIHIRRVLIV
jgi:hypothetical protein